MKTTETDLRIKAQHPKWRLPRPQHRKRRRRDPQGRASHALLPKDWLCARRSRNSFSRELRGSLASLPLEPDWPGTISRGGSTGGETFTSHSLSHVVGARPGFRRSRPGRREAGRRSDSAPSTLFGIVPVPGKTGSTAAFQTPVVTPRGLLPSLPRTPLGLGAFLLSLGFFSGGKAKESGRAVFDPTTLTTHLCLSDSLLASLSRPPCLDLLCPLVGTLAPLLNQV